MTNLSDLKAVDVQASNLTLWTFKGTTPEINGHWIETTDELDSEIKSIFVSQLQEITEEIDYTLLAQNNEGSVLTIPVDETHFDVIQTATGQSTPARKTKDIKTLRNAKFYVLRVVHDGHVTYAVKKTDSSWKTKSALNILTAVYKDKELDIAGEEGFRIHRKFDFFVINGSVLIADKRNFESVLNYKAAHEDDFAELKVEPEFISIFDSVAELTKFVGTNKIQLRRMAAIRAKAFYLNDQFMANLRAHYQDFGLNIQFDNQGRIVPTLETCRDIMTALLDHRLRSGFSGNNYDVPDAVQV